MRWPRAFGAQEEDRHSEVIGHVAEIDHPAGDGMEVVAEVERQEQTPEPWRDGFRRSGQTDEVEGQQDDRSQQPCHDLVIGA